MPTIKELWQQHPDKRPLRVTTKERRTSKYFDIHFISKAGWAYGMDAEGDGESFHSTQCNDWTLFQDPPKMVRWCPAIFFPFRGEPILSDRYFCSEREAKVHYGRCFIRLEERLAIELPESEGR